MEPHIKKVFNIILLITLSLILSISIASAEDDKEKKEEEEKPKTEVKITKYVFFIGLQGMDSDDLAKTPNLNGLASAGIKIPNALTVKPENFSVAVASLLTGQDPVNHNYLSKGDKIKGENLIEIYQKTNRNVLFVDGTKDGLEDIGQLSKNFQEKIGNPNQGIEKIVQNFPKEKPYLTTLFLTMDSKDKEKTVQKADQEIGRLFSFLHQQGIYENTLFVITGIKEDKAFTILKGPGLKGGITQSTARIIDIFPTVINLTDGKVPEKVDGLVLWNVIKAGPGYSELNLLQKRVNELSLSQESLTKALYEATEEKRLALKAKGNILEEKESTDALLDAKDDEIEALKLKIAAMKFIGVMMVIGFSIGYVIEYIILRKRFLMF